MKGYFKSFKENFKQATIIWLIALVVGIIFAGDFMILRNSTVSFGKVIMVLITIVAVIYLFTMIYIFPVLSRFENTVKNTIRNSFLMSVLNLPKTILLIIINLIPTVLLLVTLQEMCIRDRYPEEQRGQFEGIKQIFFVCIPMITGPAIATQVINRMGVEMEVSGTMGMVPAPSLFLVSALLTLFTLIPLAAAGRLQKVRQRG